MASAENEPEWVGMPPPQTAFASLEMAVHPDSGGENGIGGEDGSSGEWEHGRRYAGASDPGFGPDLIVSLAMQRLARLGRVNGE